MDNVKTEIDPAKFLEWVRLNMNINIHRGPTERQDGHGNKIYFSSFEYMGQPMSANSLVKLYKDELLKQSNNGK